MSEPEYSSLVKLLGRFVTAKIKGEEEARQGWIVEIDPFVIRDRSGTRHECEGYPTLVSNPPDVVSFPTNDNGPKSDRHRAISAILRSFHQR